MVRFRKDWRLAERLGELLFVLRRWKAERDDRLGDVICTVDMCLLNVRLAKRMSGRAMERSPLQLSVNMLYSNVSIVS
jgi:hypothetical protein